MAFRAMAPFIVRTQFNFLMDIIAYIFVGIGAIVFFAYFVLPKLIKKSKDRTMNGASQRS